MMGVDAEGMFQDLSNARFYVEWTWPIAVAMSRRHVSPFESWTFYHSLSQDGAL